MSHYCSVDKIYSCVKTPRKNGSKAINEAGLPNLIEVAFATAVETGKREAVESN